MNERFHACGQRILTNLSQKVFYDMDDRWQREITHCPGCGEWLGASDIELLTDIEADGRGLFSDEYTGRTPELTNDVQQHDELMSKSKEQLVKMVKRLRTENENMSRRNKLLIDRIVKLKSSSVERIAELERENGILLDHISALVETFGDERKWADFYWSSRNDLGEPIMSMVDHIFGDVLSGSTDSEVQP